VLIAVTCLGTSKELLEQPMLVGVSTLLTYCHDLFGFAYQKLYKVFKCIQWNELESKSKSNGIYCVNIVLCWIVCCLLSAAVACLLSAAAL
jgi:hypothetical protein